MPVISGSAMNEEPPVEAEVEDLAVIALVFGLLRLAFAGVAAEGEVNVPPDKSDKLPERDESRLSGTPMPPVMPETYIVLLPLLFVICSVMTTEPPSTPRVTALVALTMYMDPALLASLSCVAMISGERNVFVANVYTG